MPSNFIEKVAGKNASPLTIIYFSFMLMQIFERKT